MAKTLTISPAELQKVAVSYEKRLSLMPFIALASFLKDFTYIPNIRGQHVLGSMDVNAEYGPYDRDRKAGSVSIDRRVLYAHLGNLAFDFDPNEQAEDINGSFLVQGKELSRTELALKVLEATAAASGENLGKVIFTAKRNDEGTKSKDLFDGFDTITDAEIQGTKITEELGNRYDFKEAVTAQNAVEQMKAFYAKADDHLKDMDTLLYIPTADFNAYCEDYRNVAGAVSYNNQYNQVFLEGSNGKCRLAPQAAKAGSKYWHLAPKKNMCYGGSSDPDHPVEIFRGGVFSLTYGSAAFMGAQFRSIDKRNLLVGKLYQAL